MAGESSSVKSAIVKAFAVSITMAALMVLLALGFMSVIPHFISGEDISRWLMLPLGAALVIFAVSFVAAAVLLDRAGTGQLQSVIVGAIVALGVTALVLVVYAGAKSINDNTMTIDNETLLAGFALSLIASAIIDRLILKF
jgi:hypothetical protein